MEKNQIVRIKYCDYADLCSECVRFSVSGMKIISGTAHRELAERIAQSVGIQLTNVTVNTFPDGESFVKINENIRGKDVFLIQPTCPPTNHNIMELCVMVDAARRASAGRITAVVPFFGYARQDRKDQPRVPITAKLVANLLRAAGVDRIMTMDLHADQIQGFFDIPVDHLYGSTVLAPYIRSLKLENLAIASPDIGGSKRANSWAKFFDSGLVICHKTRERPNEVADMKVIGDVEGKNVVIVDDMIDTAGTICKASSILKEKGALSVRAVATHAVLSGKAYENIEKSALDEVIFTDSIPLHQECSKIKVISVADMFAETIRNVVEHRSISDHFIM